MPKPRQKPARWRKARCPRAGNLMAKMIWERDHRDDRELWRGDVHLATACPDGNWSTHVGGSHQGVERDIASAMKTAAGIAHMNEAR